MAIQKTIDPVIRLSQSIVGQRESDALIKVILDDGYLGMGEQVNNFEIDAICTKSYNIEKWKM